MRLMIKLFKASEDSTFVNVMLIYPRTNMRRYDVVGDDPIIGIRDISTDCVPLVLNWREENYTHRNLKLY